METADTREESQPLQQQLYKLRMELANLKLTNAKLANDNEVLTIEYEEKERQWESEKTELKNEVTKLRTEIEARLPSSNESAKSTTTDSSLKASSVMGKMSAKTTYQRSAKGPVSIAECHPNGNYITLENASRKDEGLAGWRINRVIDGRDTGNVTLPQGYRVPGGQKSRIYGTRDNAECSSPNDIVVNIHQWGVGANITTKLVNPNNEDRATHQQKTIYQP